MGSVLNTMAARELGGFLKLGVGTKNVREAEPAISLNICNCTTEEEN